MGKTVCMLHCLIHAATGLGHGRTGDELLPFACESQENPDSTGDHPTGSSRLSGVLSVGNGARFSPGEWSRICKSLVDGASLVARWLRIHLPMQGTWVQALGRKDPTCCAATKPVHHNY